MASKPVTRRMTRFGKFEGYDLKVGMQFGVETPMTLYTRPTEKNKWAVNDTTGFRITAENKTGRRLTCEFLSKSGEVILTRRGYREFAEWMLEQMNIVDPDTGATIEAGTEPAVVTA